MSHEFAEDKSDNRGLGVLFLKQNCVVTMVNGEEHADTSEPSSFAWRLGDQRGTRTGAEVLSWRGDWAYEEEAMYQGATCMKK